MRTLYFDCFAGASGDMLLGALIDLGVPIEELTSVLAKLNLPGWRITTSTVSKRGVSAVKADVLLSGDDGDVVADADTTQRPVDLGGHRHGHPHRSLADIERIILDSELEPIDKERSVRIFRRLGAAEAKIHGVPIDQIHFHEVGGVDAIVDITGVCVALRLLNVDRVVVSPIHVGKGFITMAHGRYPVPAPATLNLLVGAPIYSTDVVGELITPTGAALLTTLGEAYGPLPALTIERVGYGAGRRDRIIPNVLRAIIGTESTRAAETAATMGYLTDSVTLLEAQVDDATPEMLGHAMDQLFTQGALDVLFTPVQMKKNRPGALIQVLCRVDESAHMLAMLFAETTTLGVRSQSVTRYTLDRAVQVVHTAYGEIRYKVGWGPIGAENGAPEFEDCRTAAQRANVPLKAVYTAAIAAWHGQSHPAAGGEREPQ